MRRSMILATTLLTRLVSAEAPAPLPPASVPPAATTLPTATSPSPAPSPATVPSSLSTSPTKPKVTGEIHASYLKSSGTSSLETLKGLMDARHVRDVWTHEIRLEVLNESDSVTGAHTRERYLAIEKSSWNFTPRDYLFLRPQFEKDRQSVYDYQAMLTTGYGHQFFKTEKLLLTLDAGVGLRHSKHRITRDHDEDTVANTALRFEWRFRPGGRLTEHATVEAGEENTIMRTRTALNFALTGVLGMFVAYETKHDDASLSAGDTLVTFGISYQLK